MSGDHEHHREPIGSAAEEAAKLFGAISEWAKSANHALDEHLATGAPECTYCPVCRTVHVVREASPEIRAHVASAAAALMQAAASVLAAAARVPDSWPPSSTHDRSGAVETIDLDGDWPDEPEGESS